jgi:exodeoxyribonuclease VII small subunit
MGKRKTEKQPSFEDLMERLEEIAAELESGELGLQKAIERYEEGVRCYGECHRILTSAEKKVEILTRTQEGTLEAKPFEEAAEPDEEGGETEKKADPARGEDAGRLPF